MRLLSITLLAGILWVGCNTGESTPPAILGNWTGVLWTVENESSGRDAGAVRFSFDQTKHYEASFGGQQEKGTFKVDGNKLYTTAEGQMQKMVKIIRLGADTLEIEMNRAGTKENLILAKTQ